jgi:anti-sigma factor RsiW
MASTPSHFVLDADLHGLVDGCLDADRRTEALKRLAGSPADRARVEAWQAHNETLRSAFAGVHREPLPAMLDLVTKPRLQCIPANDAALVQSYGEVARAPVRHDRVGFIFGMLLVIAAGLGTTWLMFDASDQDDDAASVKPRLPIETVLATRSSDALAQPPVTPIPPPFRDGDRMPTTQIPDLRGLGFSFVSAEANSTDPASILFRYQAGTADSIVVSVARSPQQDQDSAAAPTHIGNAYTWRRRDQTFSIAGSLRPARLRAIAVALQRDNP